MEWVRLLQNLKLTTGRRKTTTHTIGFSNYPPTKNVFLLFPYALSCNFFFQNKNEKSRDISILVSMALFDLNQWTTEIRPHLLNQSDWPKRFHNSVALFPSLFIKQSALLRSSTPTLIQNSTIKQMHEFSKPTESENSAKKNNRQKESVIVTQQVFMINGDWLKFVDDKRRWNEYDDNINSAISFLA